MTNSLKRVQEVPQKQQPLAAAEPPAARNNCVPQKMPWQSNSDQRSALFCGCSNRPVQMQVKMQQGPPVLVDFGQQFEFEKTTRKKVTVSIPDLTTMVDRSIDRFWDLQSPTALDSMVFDFKHVVTEQNRP